MPNLPTAQDLETVTIKLPTLCKGRTSEEKVALEQAILTALVNADPDLFNQAELDEVIDIVDAYNAGAR